jgi:hypothetical protein
VKRPLLLLSLAAAALTLPSAASARVIELGAGVMAGVKPNCPPADKCEVASRMTGYQIRAGATGGAVRNPFRIPRAGYIVAFTVALGKPDRDAIAFFNDSFGPPAVKLAVLRQGKRGRKRLDHRLMVQSKSYPVSHFFLSRPTFAFSRPMRVRRNNIVALTVPSWAPILASNLTRTDWWRSSRPRRTCKNTAQQAAQQTLRRVVKYQCGYRTARLLYSATYVPDPRPTDNPRRRR